MRALRDELRTRLERNEDYRAWKALDDALRALEPPRMPKASDFVVEASRTEPPELRSAFNPQQQTQKQR